MYEWKEVYESGVNEIDAQHKILLKMMRDILNVIKTKRKDRGMEAAVKFLHQYIDIHFSFEEGYMLGIEFPLREKNAQEHEKFRRQLSEFEKKFLNEGYTSTLVDKFVQMIGSWFIHHIVGIDGHMKEYLENRGKIIS